MTGASPFDRIVVIFNPNSTGAAPQLAEELQHELRARLPGMQVDASPTERAGHARELAREAAGTGRPLIVSVSGDGGYNEVVDGVMQAGNADAVCAVMSAGNANDHGRTLGERPLVDAIVAGEVRRIDLLRLSIGEGADTTTHYAHSYIGVGLTPVVAVDLEKGGKGSFREIVSVVRTFWKFRPFTIELTGGRRRSLDSLIFANINQMAKVATLSDDGAPDDGRFEIVSLPHTTKWQVVVTAVRAATSGLGAQPSATTFSFTTVTPMPMQLDGELMELDARTAVRVDIAPGALATVS